ncbi:MAG: DUF4920 domain-containing protein [Proteobacteria bacterium]|nr:DUF4920 domain-containing protein [Pseudomonadota bacterium]
MKKITVLLLLLIFASVSKSANLTGAMAPDFKLYDQDNNSHQLSDYAGGWLVLYFYPKDDTRGCTIEAKEFKGKFKKFGTLDTTILGISMDDQQSHLEFIEKYQLPFNLLADIDKKMSVDYGVDGGFGMLAFSKRQTFIIDPNGTIVKHFENVDPKTHATRVIDVLITSQQVFKTLANETVEKSSSVVVTETIDGNKVYGEKWPKKNQSTIDIADLLVDTASNLDKNLFISGNITKVCQKAGCWMILANGEHFARIDFNDHAFFIPKDSKGSAVVYGKLHKTEMSEEQKDHLKADGIAEAADKPFEIIATSVMLKK